MTQQTTPRKTVEAAAMIARECAKGIWRIWPATRHPLPPAFYDELIRQAISDAVKGSGAVEAFAELISHAPNYKALGDWQTAVESLNRLRALTLPDQPTK